MSILTKYLREIRGKQILGKQQFKLSRKEENDLMGIISDANDLDRVQREIRDLYRSVAFSVWAKLIRKFIPPKTEDILEEPFMESWRLTLDKRKTYQKNNPAFNWILTIAINTTLNLFNSAEKRLKESNDILSLSSDNSNAIIKAELHNHLISVITLVNYEKILELLQDTLKNEMSELERKAFTLWFWEEKTQREIADIMNCSLGTVNTLIKAARNNIKYHLEKNNVEIEKYV